MGPKNTRVRLFQLIERAGGRHHADHAALGRMDVAEQQIRAGREIGGDGGILRIAPDRVVEDRHLNAGVLELHGLFLGCGVGVDGRAALDDLDEAGRFQPLADLLLIAHVHVVLQVVQIRAAVRHG